MRTPRFAARWAEQWPRLYFIGPAVCWAGVIIALSQVPGSDLPQPDFPMVDKIVHLFEYTVLGALVARAIARKRRLVFRAAMASALMVAAFGFSDELHQILIEDRFYDLADWTVDCLGAVAGAGIWAAISRKRGG